MSIKLILADDDALIRESLKIILSTDKEIEIVGVYENGKDAIEEALNNKVDVALLDVRMPLVNGVEATKEITSRTDTKVIILTTFDEDGYIKDGLKYGAKGYLLKSTHPQKIIEAIKMVSGGNCVIQQEILEKFTSDIYNKSQKARDNTVDKARFTERELEIMEGISEGLSNKEIATSLFISEGTVKNYITSIFQKTGLTHRTQIAIYYIKGNI